MLKRGSQKVKEGKKKYDCYLILGGPGEGKSTLIRDLIDYYRDTYKEHYEYPIEPKVFVHALSNSPTFEMKDIGKLAKKKGFDPLDIIRCVDEFGMNYWWHKYKMLKYYVKGKKRIQTLIETLSDHFLNGLVVLDEWTTWVYKDPRDWELDFGVNRRNYGMEVMYVCHMVRKVPYAMSNSKIFRWVYLFDTGENLNKKDFAKWSCEEMITKAYYKVKKRALKKAPQRVQYHIRIDTENRVMAEYLPEKDDYFRVK